MTRPVFWLTLSLLGLAQLAVGWWVPPAGLQPRENPPLIARGGVAACPVHAGFGDDAVYDATRADTAPPGVERFGSWLPGVGDAGTGRLETPWFAPGDGFEVLVAGYPAKPGNGVFLQLRRAATDGTAETPERETSLPLPDAHEQWVRHHVPVPADGGPWRARLVAVDGSREPGGWLGVSAPFREGRHTLAWSLGVLGRLGLALAATVAALLGPGLAWRAWRRETGGTSRVLGFALLPLPGAAWLVGVALAAWRLAAVGVNPHAVAVAGLAPLFLVCAVVFRRVPARGLVTPTEGRVLTLAGLVLVLALAHATFSPGPPGELYGGTVSRTLEVGRRSDSRIAFHTVQVVAHGWSPFSGPGAALFGSWGFSSRGPLPALVSAPLVLAAGAAVPATMPDQPWQPFDREGFAVYRLAMMALAALALLPLHAAGALLPGWARAGRVDPGIGLLAVGFAALSPFVVHEVYFTWGKLSAAGGLAAAAAALAARRFALAGGLVGLGYLCHPLALLFAPFLGLGALGVAWREGNGGRLRAAAWAGLRFGLPLLVIAGVWWWVGNGDRAAGKGQGTFLNYVFEPSQRAGFDPALWLRHRRDSVLNTLIPLWSFAFHADNVELNSILGPSPAAVRFFLQDAANLPFGIGLLGCLPLLGRLARVARARPGVFALAVVAPFLGFAVYFGSSSSGLTREGLHPWLLALFVLAASRPGAGRGEAILLAGRGVEVGALCLWPALMGHAWNAAAHAWTDAATLLLQLAALSGLTVLCFRVYRESGHPRDHEELLAHGPPQPGQAQEEPHQE